MFIEIICCSHEQTHIFQTFGRSREHAASAFACILYCTGMFLPIMHASENLVRWFDAVIRFWLALIGTKRGLRWFARGHAVRKVVQANEEVMDVFPYPFAWSNVDEDLSSCIFKF